MRFVIPSELLLHTSPLFPTDSANGVVHGAVSLVDVDNSAIPHPPRLRNIFGSCSIVMRLIQQFQGLAEAAVGTHAYINLRVIFEILAVIDRSPLDLADGCTRPGHKGWKENWALAPEGTLPET
jgi:hypothetical protein